jgi:hypothetical protein
MKHQLKYKPPGKKLLTGSNEHVKLDFSIPEHAEFFLERFGGEENVKTKYPLVYEAYQRSKQKSLEEKSHIKQDDDVKEDMIENQVNLEGVGFEKAPIQSDPQDRTSGYELMISSKGWLQAQNPLPYVALVGELDNETPPASTEPEILNSFAFYDDGRTNHYIEGKLQHPMQDIVRWNDQRLSSTVEFYYIMNDKTIHSENIKSSTMLCEGQQAIVTSFEVTDPGDKSGKQNNPLIALYGRHEDNGEKADYTYLNITPDALNFR